MSFRSKAIFNTHSDVVSLDAETDAYDKDGNSITLDESKIKTEESRLQAEWDAQAYARNRKDEYPDLAEQFDLLFHDMTSGKGDKTGEWYKAVNKVKTDNPKG